MGIFFLTKLTKIPIYRDLLEKKAAQQISGRFEKKNLEMFLVTKKLIFEGNFFSLLFVLFVLFSFCDNMCVCFYLFFYISALS